MDLEKQIHDLRKRISALRAQLDTNNNYANNNCTSSSKEDPSTSSVEVELSAADIYKAKLLGKKSQ